MIMLTRIKGGRFAINSDQIETIDGTPDTVITMLNGHRYIVKEPVETVIEMIVDFRRNCQRPTVL